MLEVSGSEGDTGTTQNWKRNEILGFIVLVQKQYCRMTDI
jgi:hypothetical protein